MVSKTEQESSSGSLPTEAQELLRFWFEELAPKEQFIVSEKRDREMEKRFGTLHHAAACGELSSWRESAAGRLAEIILLDQLSRNIYRGTAQAFAQDRMALCLAQEAVRGGADTALVAKKRVFVYMPYMHSESLAVHDSCLALFESLVSKGEQFAMTLEYEHKHRDIIKRFGRYPHRNTILKRLSSKAEEEFLTQPNSSF